MWRAILSRHPSLTPICQDPHPLHHYTHPFNLTSRWWLEACEVCMSTCACAYRSLCVRCFSPYANHSPVLRINLQMCHYPSGSAAITLQLHNSRLASWAPRMHAGKCMRAHMSIAPHTHTHTNTYCCYNTEQKSSHVKMLHSDTISEDTTFCSSKRYSECLQCNHSSSPQCQQDSNQGQLCTFTHSCFLATLSRSVASLRTSTASHNSFISQIQ